MSGTAPHRNVAARMGRWSASHWKTATFGWLALVVVAFGIGGMIGTKNIDPNTSGPGQSGRMDRILDAGFKQPAAENVLIQSRDRPRRHSRVRRGCPGRRRPHLEGCGRPERRSAPNGRPKDGHAVLVDFDIRGDKDKAAGQGRPGPRRGRRRPGRPPGLLHRRDRRRQRRRKRSSTSTARISARRACSPSRSR